MALDTRESSAITDHAFEPRHDNPYLCGHQVYDPDRIHPVTWESIPAYRPCNLAEAAHRDTTIRRYACGLDAEAEVTCDSCPDPDGCIDGSYRETTIERKPNGD